MPLNSNKQLTHCFELKINIPEEYKTQLAALLGALGITDFVYGSLSCDIEAEYNPSKVNRDFYSELANNIPLIIYSEDQEYLESVQAALQMLFPPAKIPLNEFTFVISALPDQEWKESWKESFQPISISQTIIILPPWEDKNLFSEKYKIVIDPGMAFGTGQHETTRLCLESLLEITPLPKRVLDVGSGSGILAIAAKMLGCEFVVGIDLDSDSIPIAKENAKVNLPGNSIGFFDTPVAELAENNFDLILANIQTQPLMSIIPSICKRVGHNCSFIFSGILSSEKDIFVEFVQTQNLTFVSYKKMGDWISVFCQKK